MNEEIRESDRELLQYAAKAVEMPKGSVMGSGDYLYEKNGVAVYWNPLTDDGDALRLAVKCGIEFQFSAGATWVELGTGPTSVHLHHEPHNGDPYAATRRAIVRAAAEIGRNMV
jgi:hypothetical protein